MIRSIDADIPLELLSAAPGGDAHDVGRATRNHPHEPQHGFVSRFVPCAAPLDRERLRAFLGALMPRVLRAKGFALASGSSREQWLAVQACGRTVGIEPRRPASERAAPAPGIVFIGLDDLPPEQELADAIVSCAGPDYLTSTSRTGR